MEPRKVTAKLSTPSPATATAPATANGTGPALRARTRRILEPTTPILTPPSTRPTALRAASARDATRDAARDAASLEGMAPRRAVVRAATSFVIGEGKGGSEVGGRVRSVVGVGSPVSVRAESTIGTTNPRVAVSRREEPSIRIQGRVSSPISMRPDAQTSARGTPTSRIGTSTISRRDDSRLGQSTSRRQDTAPRIPALQSTNVNLGISARARDKTDYGTAARDPVPSAPLSPLATLRRDEALPNVSPRSGRREAARKVRAAIPIPDVSLGAADPESESDDNGGGSERSRVSSVSSGSTGLDSSSNSAEEEPPPGLPPLVISAEIRRQILDEEDAKRSRKIADLEISNTSLMSINHTLEADVARMNRLIQGMKRQLRASGQAVLPLHDSESESESTTSDIPSSDPAPLEHPRQRRPSETELLTSTLQASEAHTDALRQMNEQLGRMVERGREAVRRVEEVTEGGKGKVLAGWEVGDGDRDADAEEGDADGDDGVDGDGDENGAVD